MLIIIIFEVFLISCIQLDNFKCYKRQAIDLADLTVFCGNNSVGKSTVMQALLLLVQGKFSD